MKLLWIEIKVVDNNYRLAVVFEMLSLVNSADNCLKQNKDSNPNYRITCQFWIFYSIIK